MVIIAKLLVQPALLPGERERERGGQKVRGFVIYCSTLSIKVKIPSYNTPEVKSYVRILQLF